MLKIPFVLGLGVGFVLGARAGRERYDQIAGLAKRTKDNPTVASAADAVAAKGEGAFREAKSKVAGKVADRAPDWMPGSRSGNGAPDVNGAGRGRTEADASQMPGAAPTHL